MEELPTVVMTSKTFPETRAFFSGVAHIVANENVEPWTRDALMARCRDATGLMAFMPDRIDGDFLEACPKLRVIGAALKGFDNIDVDAATSRGVWVTIVDDLLTVPTAELAIGLMLSLGRHMLKGDQAIRESGFRGWRPLYYGLALDGAHVGIVGFGRVGQAIAERLIGFRCKVIVHDSAARRIPRHLASAVEMVALRDLLGRADYVVLALPLSASTQHLISARTIAQMKRGALVINPARGSLVDEAAIADAIESGYLGGYAADVFECEDWARVDRPDSIENRLLAPSAPTVLTPHIGSAVVQVRQQIEASAALSIIDVLVGRDPRGAVNEPHSRQFPC